jgi:alpha-D-glucose phosphate-specific phosphoglucomutase
MSLIAFGTSGWRGIIAEDFTFTGVRAVSRAIGEHLQSRDTAAAERGVVIGYDTRFLSEAFAAQVARVLAALGLRSLLCQRDTPTPVVAHEVLRRRAAGGVMITAGHNPPEYNGVRVLAAHGGPASPDTTQKIQERANALLAGPRVDEVPSAEAEAKGLIQRIDPRDAYLERLRSVVRLDAIRAAGLKVVVDPLHGCGLGYLDAVLRETSCDVTVLHGWRDPRFGGHAPEPSDDRLEELAFHVAETSAHLGLATDGDAGRFGLVDADGTTMEPNYFLGLLFRHLVRTRGWSGGVARSVATSHLLDAVAHRLGAPIHETPVGFTHIGALMATDAVVLGGDESAGLSVRGHVPGRDGILACLLAAELVASRGRARLRALLQELYAEVGTLLSTRVNYPMDPRAADAVQQRLQQPPGSVAGLAVIHVNRLDGVKLVLEDGSWLLFRTSETEPMVRFYAEAGTPKLLEGLVKAGEALIGR